jgi:phosphate transport system protein
MVTQDLHTYQPFNQELDHVRNQVLKMGGMVEHQIRQAINGWDREDVALLQKVFEGDLQVNQLEVDLDELCRQVIARRQPIAVDLRLLTTVMKLTTDLERIGDEASKIARLADKMIAEGVDSSVKSLLLLETAEKVIGMLRESLDAYARLDTHTAGQVMVKDGEVDAAVKLMTMRMVEKMERQEQPVLMGVRLILMAKALERIGDHATNIAEDVIYMVKGKDVRHRDLDDVLSHAG